MFAKDTDEYYFHVQRNMYELADFAADKLGRTVFFNPNLSMQEKNDHALLCGKHLLNAYEETKEPFFLMLAQSFLGRMENDLNYRGGSDEQVTSVMAKHLDVVKKLQAKRSDNTALDHAFDRFFEPARSDFLRFVLDYHINATGGRRAELLQNPDYRAVLDKYSAN